MHQRIPARSIMSTSRTRGSWQFTRQFVTTFLQPVTLRLIHGRALKVASTLDLRPALRLVKSGPVGLHPKSNLVAFRPRARGSATAYFGEHQPMLAALLRGDFDGYQRQLDAAIAADEVRKMADACCVFCRALMVTGPSGFHYCPYERHGDHKKARAFNSIPTERAGAPLTCTARILLPESPAAQADAGAIFES